MSHKIPKAREEDMYNEEGNCSNCGSEDSAMGSPYETSEGLVLQDIYCEVCGTILDVIDADE